MVSEIQLACVSFLKCQVEKWQRMAVKTQARIHYSQHTICLTFHDPLLLDECLKSLNILFSGVIIGANRKDGGRQTIGLKKVRGLKNSNFLFFFKITYQDFFFER